jgi:hypothetical protein
VISNLKIESLESEIRVLKDELTNEKVSIEKKISINGALSIFIFILKIVKQKRKAKSFEGS